MILRQTGPNFGKYFNQYPHFSDVPRGGCCNLRASLSVRRHQTLTGLSSGFTFVSLDALLSELQDNVRLETRMRITTMIAQAYQRMGLPNPDWLYKAR